MASITNINSTDLITDSRANLNDNFANLNADKLETSVLDTDTTLAANSDSKVATQKAVKAYVDSGGNVNATETTKGIVEIATDAEVAAGNTTGSTGATLVMTPAAFAATTAPVVNVYEVGDSPATWTKPSGLKYVVVELVGGGGGSAGASDSTTAGGGGGGGGGYSKELISAATLGATETVTIGAGGTAGATSGSGGAGGTTSFGSLLQATGGSGGTFSGAGGAGGVGTLGDINSKGGGGSAGGSDERGGAGGSSHFGGGAGSPEKASGTVGFAGGVYGGGASGSSSSNGSGTIASGAAGAGGVVIVTEYYV